MAACSASSIVLSRAVQCSAVQCRAVQCSADQHTVHCEEAYLQLLQMTEAQLMG